MTESHEFFPPRTSGLFLHIVLFLAILTGIISLLVLAFQFPAGGILILCLLGALILFSLLPFAAYRGYALMHASYSLERDGFRIRWGLRSEDIPLPEVVWVRPASELAEPLHFPRFSFPGAFLGEVKHRSIGKVEFMASSRRDLVLVATTEKTLAVSPEAQEDFVRKFQRMIEMGSLTPIQPHTAIPAAFLRQVMANRSARMLIPLNLVLTLILMAVTSLIIPGRQSISLGFDSAGIPLEPVSTSRLLLLPIISVIFMLIDVITGLFFFRKMATRPIAYFVWWAGVVTSVLLIVSVIVLLSTPARGIQLG